MPGFDHMKTGINQRIVSVLCMAVITVMALPGHVLPVEDPLLSEWSDFSGKPECLKLMDWLRCQVRERLTGILCKDRFDAVMPRYFGQLGMFVTLKKGKNVRGCYGAFSHSVTDVKSLFSDYLTGALTRDPRYKPLDVSELVSTRIIITITSQPFPVNDPGSLDLDHYGIVLQCGDRVSIYVPAEIKNNNYIEKIMQGGSCQVSAFKAVTLQ